MVAEEALLDGYFFNSPLPAHHSELPIPTRSVTRQRHLAARRGEWREYDVDREVRTVDRSTFAQYVDQWGGFFVIQRLKKVEFFFFLLIFCCLYFVKVIKAWKSSCLSVCFLLFFLLFKTLLNPDIFFSLLLALRRLVGKFFDLLFYFLRSLLIKGLKPE